MQQELQIKAAKTRLKRTLGNGESREKATARAWPRSQSQAKDLAINISEEGRG